MNRYSSQKSDRQTARGTRPRPREAVPIDELRQETARRAAYVLPNDPAGSPMLVAAAALLYASGRHDFTERELRLEADRLAAELRSRYDFQPADRDAAVEPWSRILERLEQRIPPSAFAMWIEPIEPVALAGGRLWLTAPGQLQTWLERRYTGLLRQAAGELVDDVVWMGSDQAERLRPTENATEGEAT